jgi:hypothetical protein
MLKKIWFGLFSLLAFMILLGAIQSGQYGIGLLTLIITWALFYLPYKLVVRLKGNNPTVLAVKDYVPSALEANMLEKHQQALDIASSMQMVLHEVKNIETFADIDRWDSKAEKYVQGIELLSSEISNILSDCESKLALGVQTSSEKSNLLALCSKLATTIERLDKTREALELAIDFTPNTPQEAKELIKDLKLMKKELALEKKEVALEMKAVSVEARQRNAKIGTSYYQSSTTRRMDRSSRIRLRLQKEAALFPHENQKMLIDRQILDIDKNILWIEKLR